MCAAQTHGLARLAGAAVGKSFWAAGGAFGKRMQGLEVGGESDSAAPCFGLAAERAGSLLPRRAETIFRGGFAVFSKPPNSAAEIPKRLRQWNASAAIWDKRRR